MAGKRSSVGNLSPVSAMAVEVVGIQSLRPTHPCLAPSSYEALAL